MPPCYELVLSKQTDVKVVHIMPVPGPKQAVTAMPHSTCSHSHPEYSLQQPSCSPALSNVKQCADACSADLRVALFHHALEHAQRLSLLTIVCDTR